jgi:hypothetical protein
MYGVEFNGHGSTTPRFYEQLWRNARATQVFEGLRDALNCWVGPNLSFNFFASSREQTCCSMAM